MKFTRKLTRIAGFSFLLAMSFPKFAHAYIDPATTSYLIQIVAGLFITLGVFLGVFWKKIGLFFRNMKIKAMEKKIAKEAEKKKED